MSQSHDAVDGLELPRVKVQHGVSGSASDVSPDAPFPVRLGSGDLVKDAWGVSKVSIPISLFHGLFTFDIPASMWFMYENGTQVYTSTEIASVGGCANLTTDVTNTTLKLESKECPRYQPNRGHLFSTAGWFPSKTADGVREWGLCTDENGVFFRLKADGLLYAVLLSGGVETQEDLIDTSGLTGFDVEKSNIYDIQFQWRSAGNYMFFIGDPATGESKLVHTFSLLGTLTSASMENPALPICFKAIRTTENVEINIGCADITSENGLQDKEVYESAFTEAHSGVGANWPAIIIHQPLQISGVTNTRTANIARITVNSSKKTQFKIWKTRDAANITGATFAAIGNGSFVETDSPDTAAGAVRATAVTVANLEPSTIINAEANSREQEDNPFRGRIEIPFVRGDYLIVTCKDATATADVVAEWGEQV
ncbi:hypothetical protein KAR91_08700 [Candidatus Pacearchaeota archaeon]|nr:hypothetical protein [Candidatus Pacearchaeota archaeon]